MEVEREEDLCPRYSAIRSFHCTPDWRGRDRVTESYEFSFYLEGGGSFWEEGRTYPIREGCWRFTLPGRRVSSTPSYRCLTLRFSLGSEDGIAVKNPFLDAIPSFFQSREPEKYPPLLEEMEALLYSPELGAGVRRKMAMYTLLNLIFRDATRAVEETPADRSVREAKEYLAEHFREEVTLSDLGARFGYHPLYFQRLFRERTGATPHSYRSELRLSRAKTLLSTTNLAIGEVAEECGFGSVSHFNAVFRENTGLSPSGFRKKYRLYL